MEAARKPEPYHRQLPPGSPLVVVRNGFLDVKVPTLDDDVTDHDKVASMPRTLSAPALLNDNGKQKAEVSETDIDSDSISSFDESQATHCEASPAIGPSATARTTVRPSAIEEHEEGEFDMEMTIDESPDAYTWQMSAGAVEQPFGMCHESTSWMLPESAWPQSTEAVPAIEEMQMPQAANESSMLSWMTSPQVSCQASPTWSFQMSPALVAAVAPQHLRSPEMLAQGAMVMQMPAHWAPQQVSSWSMGGSMAADAPQQQVAVSSPKASPKLSPKQSPKASAKASPKLLAKDAPQTPMKSSPKVAPKASPKLSPRPSPKLSPKMSPALIPQVPEFAPQVLDVDGVLGSLFSKASPPPLAHTIIRAISPHTGVHRIVWTVDAGKLKNQERQAVSPCFELPLGEPEPVISRLVIFPKPNADGKGSASFKKSNGFGSVHLKCEASGGTVSFQIFISDGTEEYKRKPRGPVVHNFAEHSTVGLPKEQEQWDFNRAINKSTQTFSVCIDILPHSGTERHSVTSRW